MRQHTSEQATMSLSLIPLVLVALGMCCLPLVAYLTSGSPCDTPGTDYWYEVCMDMGEVDLSGDMEPYQE